MAKVVLLALAVVAGAAPVSAQSDKEAVLEVVTRVFDGMRTRDTVLMRSLFAPHARMVGWDARQTPPTPRVMDPGVWIGGVGRGTGAGPDERIFDPEVRVEDNIAQVWTYYELWVGTKLSHCGYDAFFLVKMPEGWKINQVADTRSTTCTPRS